MSAPSALPAVWNALYDLLNVAAITTTLACPVYDFVPTGAAYPYLALSSPTENRLDTMGKAGKAITVQVHFFSSYEGAGQVLAILSAVANLTNYAALNLAGSGFDLIFCRPEDVHEVGDEDVVGVPVKHYVQLVRVEVMQQ